MSTPAAPAPAADMSRDLDRVDRQLLALLQGDGRLTVAELARTVNLTLTPCIERVRRLEREGYIEGYFARLSARRLGQQLLAFTEVTLDHGTPDVFQRFKDAVAVVDEIVECHMVAGGFDYLLKTRVQDMDEYRRVLGDKIANVRGVRHTQTYFVLEEVKATHAIRIRPQESGRSATHEARRRRSKGRAV
jgi:Lrp/AsnC family leucine-responsive transcriptional regulator